MKTAFFAAALTARVAYGQVAAATTRVFDSDATNNESSGQLVRVTTATNEVVILGGTTNSIYWTVEAWTRFYEDTGIEKVRLRHKLAAQIAATDSVQFELSYRPSSAAAPQSSTAIGEDFVRCQMTIDSSDARFWQASIVDGYYLCSGTADPTDLCFEADESYYQEYQEASSDWTVPFSDDKPLSPWCVTDAVVGEAVKDYACTELSCYMERAFDTGNTDYDYAIIPYDIDGGGAAWYDIIQIQAGRAKLRINPTEFGTALTNTENLEIKIYQGSLAGVAFSVAAIASTLGLLSF